MTMPVTPTTTLVILSLSSNHQVQILVCTILWLITFPHKNNSTTISLSSDLYLVLALLANVSMLRLYLRLWKTTTCHYYYMHLPYLMEAQY